jgi:hypothetical protein
MKVILKLLLMFILAVDISGFILSRTSPTILEPHTGITGALLFFWAVLFGSCYISIKVVNWVAEVLSGK